MIDFEKMNTICSIHDVLSYTSSLKSDQALIQTCISEIITILKSDNNEEFSAKLCFEKSDILLNFVWEKLNTGNWSMVDITWRKLYSLLSIMKVIFIVKLIYQSKRNYENEFDIQKDLIKMCDIGCLMGAPILNHACSRLASFFNQLLIPKNNHQKPIINEDNVIQTKKRKFENPLHSFKNLELLDEIEELGLEAFVKDYKQIERPVKITNAISHWPALEQNGNFQWNMAYFSNVMGFRTVPIEIGKRYTDDSWTQTLMTVNDFIKTYIENISPPSVGYLAQHELFSQIPELLEDFDIPFYCYSGNNSDHENDDDISINMWFGPGGTVSPLHTDPRHNCLCQVFGKKYVKLYPSNQTAFVYPYDSNDLLSNTSRINLEQNFEDIVKEFPNFSDAKGYECVLNPGDILYIPPKCWHFVKSLSNSCSLSFWFD